MEGVKTEAQEIQHIADKYCVGAGLDVGCGERKIVKEAVGIDFVSQYGIKGHPITQADFHGGWEDYFNIKKPQELDYIFSSHLIEDFDNAYDILDRWSESVKQGGYIVLYLPIEEAFKAHCHATGQLYNPHHKQNWKGYQDFIDNMTNENLQLVEGFDGPGPYSFYVVLEKK